MNTRYRAHWQVGRALGLVSLIIVLVGLSGLPDAAVSAQTVPGTPWLGFVGENMTDIQVGSVNDLYGVEFTLTFDPKYAQVAEDADPVTPGIQIAVGSLFTGRSYFVARNQVDNAQGKIEFAITLQDPEKPIKGGGGVARIPKWKILSCSAGTSLNLRFEVHNLSDNQGRPIVHEINHGKLPCPPTQPVRGTVLLQCRTKYCDTDVFLTEQPCSAVISQISTQAIIPNVPSAKTNCDGSFEVTPYPGRTYQCLTVFKHGFLVGQKNMPVGDVGRITLPAGDMNEDDVINIFDMTLIASDYGCSGNNCRGDVTGDGVCNIFDLSCAAGNYGKKGPWTAWYPN